MVSTTPRRPREMCVDCWKAGMPTAPKKLRPLHLQRGTPAPGPRCTTHHRQKVKATKATAAQARRRDRFGLEPGEYEIILAAQGGRCYTCRRATGATRALSVDHDHRTGEVRGLLCRPCNTMLGHARDAIAFFERCIDYLQYAERTGETFASKVLGRRVIVPTTTKE